MKMKKKLLSLFLVLSMLVGMLAMMPVSVSAATEYIIKDVDDWIALGEKTSVGNATITVTAEELDFAGKTVKPIKGFSGAFNGNGVVIKNLTMGSDVAVNGENGLFSCLGGDASFENLVIENSSFTGSEWIGAIACCTGGDVVAKNIYITDSVVVESTNVTVNKNSKVNSYVGGLFGGLPSSGATVEISDCVFAGTIKSRGQYCGGFVGDLYRATLTIKNSLVTGSVPVRTDDTKVDGSNYIDNSCGFVGGASQSGDTITLINCIYAGGKEDVAFYNRPFFRDVSNYTVTNCYTAYTAAGGVYNNTKWTVENSGVTLVDDVSAFYGLDAIKISGFTRRDGAIMLPSGIIGEEPATLNGSGTAQDPYEIGSAEDWAIFETLAEENTFAGEYIELTDNIDFDGIGLHPVFCEICGEKFQGTFNGAGKTISNFTVVTNEDSASLFGLLADGAVVKNLVIKNATVNSGQWTGIIAGGAIGTVEIANIYVDKDVTLDVDGYCGGILGGAYSKAESVTVKNCVFAGTIVSDGNYVAGIVGNGNSKPTEITNCMNLGTIEGSQYVAGIATSGADLTITKCINIGKISGDFCVSDIYSGNPSDTSVSVTSNYWMTKMISVNTKEDSSNGGTVTTGSNKRVELTDLIGENATLPEGFTGRASDFAVPTAIKDLVPTLLTIQLYDGASVRLDLPTGLRFTALLGNDFLKTFADGATFGIIIAPTDYIADANNTFTVDALDALGLTSAAYVKIPAVKYEEGSGYYEFTGVLANVKDYNYNRAFSARAYIEVNGEIVFYSAYDSELNSRTIAAVAKAAYNDTKDAQDDEYKYEIAPNAGVYSPYTTTQRDRLPAFSDTLASNINFMSYNIRNVEGGDNEINTEELTFEYDGRPEAVVNYILTENPDVIGIQEASVKTNASVFNDETLSWWDYLDELEANGYACFKGNNILPESDNKEMYNPIYYKADKYELVTSGFYYLSDDNTQKAVDGEYRGCTYVVLKDKTNGLQFVYVNVHMTRKNSTDNYQDDVAGYLKAILEDLAADYTCPIIIGGDFNGAYADYDDYCTWEEDENTYSYWGDTAISVRDAATNKTSKCSTVAVDEDDANNQFVNVETSSGPIDLYFALNAENVDFHNYAVTDNKNETSGKYPSDHLPIKMVATIYGAKSN